MKIQTPLFSNLSLCLFGLLIGVMLPAKAQGPTDYSVHANIVYRFTKYIDWTPAKKTGDFVIGVVGESPLIDKLKQITSNKKVGEQKIVVKAVPAAEVDNGYHIVYVPEEESDQFRKILARTAGQPILIVTESEGFGGRGSCINFNLEEEHLKLEINKNAIENRRLKIATELLALGKVIQ